MDPNTVALLGPISGILIGIALLVVVWLFGLSAAVTATPRRGLRAGWLLVGFMAIAIIVLASIRLAAMV